LLAILCLSECRGMHKCAQEQVCKYSCTELHIQKDFLQYGWSLPYLMRHLLALKHVSQHVKCSTTLWLTEEENRKDGNILLPSQVNWELMRGISSYWLKRGVLVVRSWFRTSGKYGVLFVRRWFRIGGRQIWKNKT